MRAAEQYRNLEFDRLLEQLSGYAGSELTRALIQDIELVFHPARVDENLQQTGEALSFLEDNPSVALPPFSSLADLSPLWQMIVAGELVDNQQARSLLSFFSVCESFSALLKHIELKDFPRLTDVAAAWQPLADLASHARRVFSEDGEVRDGASTELARVRKQLRKFEGEAGRGMHELMQSIKQTTGEEALVTIRSNRFVVMLPRALVTQHQGTVVDVSGSGQSVYFEPKAVANLNTDRQHLFLEEDQEVRRILRDFGVRVAAQHELLQANLAILVKFDYIFARARHARAITANPPQMSHADGFELRGAIHPLLYADFVPEDLVFDSEQALIISGVNAGGKTVLLKLLGLYSLMAALGCYVPGEARLPYLAGLQADIGDDQSTLANLSTFTAHLNFVTDLWGELTALRQDEPPLLILIDEIGTGTEPGEGAAFAYGLIVELLKHNCKLAVTTHYDLLKTLGIEREEVKNVCLEFDRERLKPTFRILDDQPGQSFAFAIAEQCGIDPAVLGSGREVLGEEEQKMASIIGELEELHRAAQEARREARERAAELAEAKAANEELNLELKRAKQRLAREAEKAKQDLERRIDELLAETKKKLKRKARQSTRKGDEFVKAASKQAGVVRHQKEEAEEVVEEALTSLIGDLATSTPEDWEFRLGDKVKVADSAMQGELIELDDRRREAVLAVFGKRVSVKLSKLRPLEGATEVGSHDPLARFRSSGAHGNVEESFASGQQTSSDTIDLHGQTIEEATESLDEFLSNVLLTEVTVIRVMHGVGTGRLRNFVQSYLKQHKSTTNVRFASVHDGGVGVTLADLR